ncbi:MAG TPA: AAA family ATPase [Actinomycetes bacterium]|nr:AAA family ATPase [Actinomycetes bacterium]
MFQQQVPFVGRDADLRLLELVMGRAAAGAGSVVLISGEAGIGKTRLCQELSRSHRGRGGLVLLGRAFPEEAALSFGAVADALRAARRGEPPLWQAALARASVLWAVAPELAATREVERRSFDHPVLFEALLDTVDEAAGDRVTLWVLEDLHWADEATWEFVRYAARRVAAMGLVLGVTYREEEIGAAHPWWASLVRLQRDPSVLRVSLERLSAADGERLVRALVPSLPQGLVGTIVQRSAGTPLLVEELASLAARSGALPALPDIVRATVQERAQRLGPAARDLLEVAAVAGLEVDQDLLGSLRPEPPADALVWAGLLEREDGRLRFRHPLLQEAAYQAVPPERRRAIHQELAEALARSGAHPVERVAGHLERAGQPQAALSVLEGDAEEAWKAGNVGHSATLHLAALQLARRHASLVPRRAGLEEAAIRELFLAGRWTELDPLVRDAWSRRDRLPLHERAWLANVLAVHLFWTGAVGEALALIEQELAHLEHHDALDQGAMLLAQAGFVAGFLGDDQQARRHTERALEIARRTSDVEAECRARYTHIYIGYQQDRDRQAAIARSHDTAAFARAHGLTASEATALFSVAQYTATIEDAEAAQQAAERAGAWDYANLAQLLWGTVLLLRGRADDAEAIFVRVGPEIRFSRPASPVPWVDAAEAFLHLHRGDLEETRRILHRPGASQAARSTVRVADRAAALGWLAWEEGRWEEAAEQLAHSIDSWVGGWQLMVGGPMFLPLHVDALLRLGRLADATTIVEAAASSQREPPRFFAAALAVARFRLGPTPERAAQAQSLSTAAPWPWLGALVGCWRGELLGDQQAAQAARALFERIGADLGVQRTERVLRRLGVWPPSDAGAAGPLSPRELEVAGLVAEGLSNPAIARRLYLSRPTIAHHVAHILTKLGFASRAQIAAWVVQQRSGGGG